MILIIPLLYIQIDIGYTGFSTIKYITHGADVDLMCTASVFRK